MQVETADFNIIRVNQSNDQIDVVCDNSIYLSAAGRTAVCVLIDLALHQKNGPVQLAGISERLGFSVLELEGIFSRLRSHWLVANFRGLNGGYSLARSVGRITVADIVLAVERPFFPTSRRNEDCCDPEVGDCVACVVNDLSTSLNKKAIAYLASVSLKDLIDDADRETAAM